LLLDQAVRFIPLRKKIGFVTSAEHRNLIEDDLVLAAALEKRDVSVLPVVWTETAQQATGCELLLLRSCWDYHLKPQEFLGWVSEAHKHISVINSPEIVRWNMDKHYLSDLQAAGFLVPRTLVMERGTQTDLEELMNTEGLTDAVVKPTISASAFETYRVRRDAAGSFNVKFNSLISQRAMLVQEFVKEIETGGEWSLVYIGGEFSHAVNKLPRFGDFRVQHEHGGQHRAAVPPVGLLSAASAIISRFAPQAIYCRADMVLRAQGPTLMELELIEPLLHFELAPAAAERMTELLLRHSS
jgi:glutathione synthase/RimK-type ligase-like ATP-grasp enzyme